MKCACPDLSFEQGVFISNGDSLIVAHSFRTAVDNKCQVRVTLCAISTNSFVVIITIRLQELLRALVGIDVDHRERVVYRRILKTQCRIRTEFFSTIFFVSPALLHRNEPRATEGETCSKKSRTHQKPDLNRCIEPQPIAFLARGDKTFGWAHIANRHHQRTNLQDDREVRFRYTHQC